MCGQIYFVLLRIVEVKKPKAKAVIVNGKLEDIVVGDFCVEEFYDKDCRLEKEEIQTIVRALTYWGMKINDKETQKRIERILKKLIEMLKEDREHE